MSAAVLQDGRSAPSKFARRGGMDEPSQASWCGGQGSAVCVKSKPRCGKEQEWAIHQDLPMLITRENDGVDAPAIGVLVAPINGERHRRSAPVQCGEGSQRYGRGHSIPSTMASHRQAPGPSKSPLIIINLRPRPQAPRFDEPSMRATTSSRLHEDAASGHSSALPTAKPRQQARLQQALPQIRCTLAPQHLRSAARGFHSQNPW